MPICLCSRSRRRWRISSNRPNQRTTCSETTSLGKAYQWGLIFRLWNNEVIDELCAIPGHQVVNYAPQSLNLPAITIQTNPPIFLSPERADIIKLFLKLSFWISRNFLYLQPKLSLFQRPSRRTDKPLIIYLTLHPFLSLAEAISVLHWKAIRSLSWRATLFHCMHCYFCGMYPLTNAKRFHTGKNNLRCGGKSRTLWFLHLRIVIYLYNRGLLLCL